MSSADNIRSSTGIVKNEHIPFLKIYLIDFRVLTTIVYEGIRKSDSEPGRKILNPQQRWQRGKPA